MQELTIYIREFSYLQAKKKKKKSRKNTIVQLKQTRLKLGLQQAQESSAVFTLNCKDEILCCKMLTSRTGQLAGPRALNLCYLSIN